MKKFITLIIIILITGCGDKEKDITKKDNIYATGELVCAYKENRIEENTIYTSFYQFNYNDNGILEDAVNMEIIEFNGTDEKIKNNYVEAIDVALKEYEDVSNLEATKEIEKDKYQLTIKIKVKEMDNETKEEYLVNYDRINTYKLFKEMGYTCN